jgi:hypothetical protein
VIVAVRGRKRGGYVRLSRPATVMLAVQLRALLLDRVTTEPPVGRGHSSHRPVRISTDHAGHARLENAWIDAEGAVRATVIAVTVTVVAADTG